MEEEPRAPVGLQPLAPAPVQLNGRVFTITDDDRVCEITPAGQDVNDDVQFIQIVRKNKN